MQPCNLLKPLPQSSAAAAKSLQSCLTLCDPIDGSLPGSPVPGILQARTLEWVAISFSNAWKWKVRVKSLSLTLSSPMDCSPPGSSVHGIFQARVLDTLKMCTRECIMRNVMKIPFIFLSYLIFIYFHMSFHWLKKKIKGKNMKKSIDKWLLVCPFWSGGYMTGHAGLKTVHVYKPQSPARGSKSFLFT